MLTDETLKDETDVMGIEPESLGHFEVVVFKLKSERYRLTEAEVEILEEKKKLERDIKTSQPKKLWDAQKVDEDTFEKDGISYAVGYVVLASASCWCLHVLVS